LFSFFHFAKRTGSSVNEDHASEYFFPFHFAKEYRQLCKKRPHAGFLVIKIYNKKNLLTPNIATKPL
jgi:hypothetical protein